MRAVIQRVKESSVTIENDIVGKIEAGLIVRFNISSAKNKLPSEAIKSIL